MKISITAISVLLVIIFYPTPDSRSRDNNDTSGSDSSVTIRVTVVGDLMCHSPQFEYARKGTDSFDFGPVYRNVGRYLKLSDFTFGNLETVTAGKENGNYTGYPFFNSPDSYLTALKETGFDLLVTANNHSLDRSEKGVLKTIQELVKRDLNYTGTYVSQTDRDSVRIFNIKGIRIAILAYSYGTNGNPVPKGKSYLINLIDFHLIQEDITNARKKGAELVLVHYHFGEEYKREPVQYQREVVNRTIDMGADLIIGGHPHVIQPVEFFRTRHGTLDTGFVAYSMGNFISNQQKRYTDAGLILSLEIKKDFLNYRIELEEVKFIPTWVFRGNTVNGREYVIIPSVNVSDTSFSLSETELLRMDQAFDDTRHIITKYTKNRKLKEVVE